MLDEPDTFQLSSETVEQFEELTLAHTSVVDARRQVEVLTPLRGLADTTRTPRARWPNWPRRRPTWSRG